MATSMPEVGGGRKHWREAHTKEQPESSDMSDTGSVHVIIVAIRVSVMMQQTKQSPDDNSPREGEASRRA
ncbi:hypothetical protein QC762_700260 [Podospora pseudocomata]|uniref:Uncharacterized protein n=1 Tax=Podospora pseudocomata TaxID=2093779 RepID=A0ABR0G5N8_9PEZI|nr:hypothetical protein QC762_700260 [Podospora pseudocomata]